MFQASNANCSTTSALIVINYLRSLSGESSLSLSELYTLLNNEQWWLWTQDDGKGLILTELKQLIEISLSKLNLKNYKVIVVHADEYPRKKFRKKLLKALKLGIVIANFDQEILNNRESVGHYSPLAKINNTNGSVEVIETDSEIGIDRYPVANLITAMSTFDEESQRQRGFIAIVKSHELL